MLAIRPSRHKHLTQLWTDRINRFYNATTISRSITNPHNEQKQQNLNLKKRIWIDTVTNIPFFPKHDKMEA